ncbi:MAG TPA: transcription antitermination factor NusB [Gammaproteobacteria bacterium]|nr:transcription antitermination factor NusB [Gammaproteobacteria bacterium]
MGRRRSQARRCVVQALYQGMVGGDEVTEADFGFLGADDERRVDQAYFRELLEEIRRHGEELDELIAPYVDRPLADVDPVERAILRLGACELAYHVEVPFRVVINEAVELAKVFGAEHGHRFVNGVLDKLASRLRATEARAAR